VFSARLYQTWRPHKFPLSNKPLLDKWIVAIKREEHGKKADYGNRPKTLECVMNISTPVIIKQLIIMVSILNKSVLFLVFNTCILKFPDISQVLTTLENVNKQSYQQTKR